MGRKFAPISDRMKVYEIVRKLVDAKGFAGVALLTEELRTTGCSLPSRETLRRWALAKTSPFSGKLIFEGRPSEDLSFFLGAWIGDGWADDNDGGKRLLLKVRSKDFAAEFARAATVILPKEKPYKVRSIASENGMWYLVKVTSFMLYDFVNQPLERLRESIQKYPIGFLRGFFTAEGNPSVSLSQRNGPKLDVGLDLSNSDYKLLELSRDLLCALGYVSARIRLVQLEGAATNLGVANKPGWLLTMLRFRDAKTFATEIGFADSAKQQKLADAISFIYELGAKGAARRWMALYQKQRGDWVKK